MHSTLDRKRIRTKKFLEIFSIRVSSIIYRQVCTSNYKFFSITSMNIKIIIIILSRNTKKAKEHTKASSHHQTYVALEYTLKFAAVTIHETFHSSVCLCSRISFPMCVCIHTRIRFAIYVYEYVSRLIFGVSFASVMSKFFSFPRLISRIYTYHDLQMLLLRLENCA